MSSARVGTSRRVRVKGTNPMDDELKDEACDTRQSDSFKDALMKGSASNEGSDMEQDSEDGTSDDEEKSVAQTSHVLDPIDYVIGEKDGFLAISLSS